MREGHSSATGDFEATATAKATVGDGFDAEGKLGGQGDLRGAAAATD